MQTQDTVANLEGLGLPADATTPQVEQRYQQLVAAFTCNSTDSPQLIELSSTTRDKLHRAYSRILEGQAPQQVQNPATSPTFIGVMILFVISVWFLCSLPKTGPSVTPIASTTGTNTGSSTGSATGTNTGSATGSTTGDNIGGGTGTTTGYNAGGGAGTTTADNIGTSTGTTTASTTGSNTGSGSGTTTEPPPIPDVTDGDMSQLEAKTAGDSPSMYTNLSPRNLVYYYFWSLQHDRMNQASNCWSKEYIKDHLINNDKQFQAWRPKNTDAISCPDISQFNSVANGRGVSTQYVSRSPDIMTASVDPNTFNISVKSLCFTLGKDDGHWRLTGVTQQVEPDPALVKKLDQLKSDMNCALFDMGSANGEWGSKQKLLNYYSDQMAGIRQPPPLDTFGRSIYLRNDPTGYWTKLQYGKLQVICNNLKNECQAMSEKYDEALQRYKAAFENYNTLAPQVGSKQIEANYPAPAGSKE